MAPIRGCAGCLVERVADFRESGESVEAVVGFGGATGVEDVPKFSTSTTANVKAMQLASNFFGFTADESLSKYRTILQRIYFYTR
jgi:hypothetical protein